MKIGRIGKLKSSNPYIHTCIHALITRKRMAVKNFRSGPPHQICVWEFALKCLDYEQLRSPVKLHRLGEGYRARKAAMLGSLYIVDKPRCSGRGLTHSCFAFTFLFIPNCAFEWFILHNIIM